jgi:hypothetical protein
VSNPSRFEVTNAKELHHGADEIRFAVASNCFLCLLHNPLMMTSVGMRTSLSRQLGARIRRLFSRGICRSPWKVLRRRFQALLTLYFCVLFVVLHCSTMNLLGLFLLLSLNAADARSHNVRGKKRDSATVIIPRGTKVCLFLSKTSFTLLHNHN